MCFYFQTTYEKFKANPPARIKRKAEKQRLEKEEAKRMREAEEQNNQSAIDPTTGQFIPPPLHPPNPPLNGGGDQKMVIFNLQQLILEYIIYLEFIEFRKKNLTYCYLIVTLLI